MKFSKTPLKDAFIIEPERLSDERGFFATVWTQEEFRNRGLNATVVEADISFNVRRGTLRGMHFQAVPHSQVKLVQCTMGAIYDVIIDLRPESETFKKWFGVELTQENRTMLYIPKGFAHGFQTLTDHSEVLYQMSDYYAVESARGVRWNDDAFGVEWPDVDERTINERDRSYPNFKL